MNKEELIEFLKENLKIETKVFKDWDYYSSDLRIDITLKLGEDIISTATDSICISTD